MKKTLFAVGKTIVHPIYGRGVICLTDTRGQGWIHCHFEHGVSFGCLPSEVSLPEEEGANERETLPPRGDHPAK